MNAIRRLAGKTKSGGTAELASTLPSSVSTSKELRNSTDEKADNVYGYGDTADSTRNNGGGGGGDQEVDYGYGNIDYGYGDTEDNNGPVTDYGYDGPPSEEMQSCTRSKPPAARQRSVRRNSTVIRRDDNNPLAVAEYLMGGPAS